MKRKIRKHINKHVKVLKKGEPGNRFRTYAEHFPKSENPIKRLIRIGIGVAVTLFGIILIFLPGPAFVFIPIGLLIILTQIPFVAHWLDQVEARLRKKTSTKSSPSEPTDS